MTVTGWIPIGGPFGGSAATAWLVMLAGDFMKLFPLASNLLRPEVSGQWHPTVVGKSIYNFAFGLPSWGWMLPREGVLGINQVGDRLQEGLCCADTTDYRGQCM
jgi:hypothetical protein